jgi:hypothetical protein
MEGTSVKGQSDFRNMVKLGSPGHPLTKKKQFGSHTLRLSRLPESPELGDWSLERARLQAAPYIISKDLRHGSEAVLFQNSAAGSFPQPVRESLRLGWSARKSPGDVGSTI